MTVLPLKPPQIWQSYFQIGERAKELTEPNPSVLSVLDCPYLEKPARLLQRGIKVAAKKAQRFRF